MDGGREQGGGWVITQLLYCNYEVSSLHYMGGEGVEDQNRHRGGYVDSATEE